MSTDELDQLQEAWKREKGLQQESLSAADIKQHLGKSSRDIGKLFRSGLVTDLFIKGILAACILYPGIRYVVGYFRG